MSSQTMSGKTNYNTDPNHIYYNLTLYNNDNLGSSNSVPVRFSETRTSTILANPSEYFLSIQRFHIDTPSLPVFMPEVETDITINPTQDPNQLIYYIAIYQQNSTVGPFLIPIKFSNSFNPTVLPPTQLNVNAVSNPYYFVYEFQNFIDMINQSLQTFYVNNAGTPSGVQLNQLPVFGIEAGNRFCIYFPATTTENTNISIGTKTGAGVGQSIWDTNPTAGNKWMMAFNAPMHTLFSAFRYKYIDTLRNLPNITPPALASLTSPLTRNGWYLISNRPAMNSQPNPVAGGLPVYVEETNQIPLASNQTEVISAENIRFLGNFYPPLASPNGTASFEVVRSPYSPAPLWSCVKQLIFTTALMPINNELVGLPGVRNSNVSLDTETQNNNFSPVITDLEVPLITGDEIKPSVSYSPGGEYRLTDLMSNTPINSIEISVFWKDQYGVNHPFLLEPGCYSSLKILFRRKVFNLIYLPEYTKPVN
jgi:hypothetical protein